MLLLSRFLCAISSIIDCEVVVLIVRFFFLNAFGSVLFFSVCLAWFPTRFEFDAAFSSSIWQCGILTRKEIGGHGDGKAETKNNNNMVSSISIRRTHTQIEH